MRSASVILGNPLLTSLAMFLPVWDTVRPDRDWVRKFDILVLRMSPNVVFLEEPEDTGIAGEVAGSRFREVLLFVPVLYFNSDSLSERNRG